MNLDPDNWQALSVPDVARIFRPLGLTWWIAGGWALDLYLGRPSREHLDTDVSILRQDHLRAQQLLGRDWQLFKTKQPGLAPWPPGEVLPSYVSDVWVRRDDDSPWAFQLMLEDVEEGQWVYRRLPAIRRPLAEICLLTDEGIPYLRPEIQLLYKGGSSGRRPKDLADLKRMLPLLAERERTWLRESLSQQFPAGHEWLACIDARPL